MGGLPLQVGGYEHSQQEPERQEADDHHVGRHVAHGAEHPAVDRRQDEADQLRAAVQQPAGRALRDRIRQLDGQLVADRKVSGHEQPIRGQAGRGALSLSAASFRTKHKQGLRAGNRQNYRR